MRRGSFRSSWREEPSLFARIRLLSVLRQDIEDMKAAKIQRTLTFLVNGNLLTEFGPQQLCNLLVSEILSNAFGASALPRLGLNYQANWG